MTSVKSRNSAPVVAENSDLTLMHTSSQQSKMLPESILHEKLANKWSSKQDDADKMKMKAKHVATNIVIDCLAVEWFTDNGWVMEKRLFVVDKLLPTLVLGVEKLLTEANSKGLIEDNEPSPNFNPINYLGQYLMRNNPRYSNFSEASPYIHGLRQVSEKLRQQLLDFSDSRLVNSINMWSFVRSVSFASQIFSFYWYLWLVISDFTVFLFMVIIPVIGLYYYINKKTQLYLLINRFTC